MTTHLRDTRPADIAEPLGSFSHSHREILAGLEAFAGLPGMAAAALESRAVAGATLRLFAHAVLAHHADEEAELFPAVVRSAAEGGERRRVEIMVERLTAEHRLVEALWKGLRPAVSRVANGSGGEPHRDDVRALVNAYTLHAAFEEIEFLPLARDILSRNGNHMSALGLSLHLRHAPQPVGYI